MQRDRTDEADDPQRSRPSSRRSSVSLSRQNSLKRDKDKKTPSPSHSAHSTPKKHARPSLDFMVTGKQILKRVDRANSLPGSARRKSPPPATRARPISEQEEKNSPSDMSLDFSQMSDFEEGKVPLATSTPKPHEGITDANHTSITTGNHTPTTAANHTSNTAANHTSTTAANHTSTTAEGNNTPTLVDGDHTANPVDSLRSVDARSSPARQKPRSASLQHIQARVERRTTTQQSVDSSRRSELPTGRAHQSVDLPTGRHCQSKPSRNSTFSCSRDSLFKTSSSASPYRYGTDYSSVSPDCSSTDLSPRAEPSPVLSSHSWERTLAAGGEGEWSSFWAEYGGRHYDRCPTPYREDNSHDFSDRRPRSPTDSLKQISDMILREGLRLAPHDARTVVHCAHLLGSVLSRAVERSHSREDRRRTLTLDLKTEAQPESARVQPETHEVTTQTDISLPNTKSAPKILENILRQLSKSSIDEPDLDKLVCEETSGK